LYGIAEAIGCDVTRWTLQASDTGWSLDTELLERSITSRTKLLVINFPHNPTGYLPVKSDQDAIVELARRHDLTVFSDEMYRLLELDAARRLPAMCDLYEKGVSLFGLSKTFSLPGLRIGWLVTRDRALSGRLQAFKDYTTICSSAPSEVLSIIALRARETIITRNLGIIRHNLNLAEQFCTAHAEWFSWLAPQAGSVAFPRLTTGVPIEVFCQDLLAQKGVMMVPGDLFEYPGGYFRLGLGRKNLQQGLDRVAEYIEGVGREA
jgi:aspartate/methionine/tyrosine aminotransferase